MLAERGPTRTNWCLKTKQFPEILKKSIDRERKQFSINKKRKIRMRIEVYIKNKHSLLFLFQFFLIFLLFLQIQLLLEFIQLQLELIQILRIDSIIKLVRIVLKIIIHSWFTKNTVGTPCVRTLVVFPIWGVMMSFSVVVSCWGRILQGINENWETISFQGILTTMNMLGDGYIRRSVARQVWRHACGLCSQRIMIGFVLS